ncbi:MAG: hypothetical protein JST26_13465 [Bacteroidetes bacterium]|nr:hypothetical protein [Bacteroidota bacterium]
MLTVDTIIGNKLDEIFLVQYSDTENASWKESVVLKFQHYLYMINVNSDTDELEILFHDQSQSHSQDQFNVDKDNVIKISNHQDNVLFGLLGSKLTWVWEMTNNQGYFDGIQFQFNCKANNIVQFVAIASRLQINILNATETPSI